eukprot:14950227-Alexandrium_andersonii.AAC.1
MHRRCNHALRTRNVRSHHIHIVLPLEGNDATVLAVLHAVVHAIKDHADAVVVQLGHRERGLPRVGLAEVHPAQLIVALAVLHREPDPAIAGAGH